MSHMIMMARHSRPVVSSIKTINHFGSHMEQLLGNPAKAKRQLGWEPTVKFEELVKIMTDGDLKILDGAPYSKGF